MLHPLFVAAVLEGFEGTLDEVIGRVENPELNAQLDALRGQVAALRICAEEPARQPKAGRTSWEMRLGPPSPAPRRDADRLFAPNSVQFPVADDFGRCSYWRRKLILGLTPPF
jgi:hypothetical protein